MGAVEGKKERGKERRPKGGGDSHLYRSDVSRVCRVWDKSTQSVGYKSYKSYWLIGLLAYWLLAAASTGLAIHTPTRTNSGSSAAGNPSDPICMSSSSTLAIAHHHHHHRHHTVNLPLGVARVPLLAVEQMPLRRSEMWGTSPSSCLAAASSSLSPPYEKNIPPPTEQRLRPNRRHHPDKPVPDSFLLTETPLPPPATTHTIKATTSERKTNRIQQ
ncbi:hypothetical protein BC939DRAFT_219035 [Gamsiella multidivaricata]|uniref:uncharacterized protein n=1 Tax=Gamsiella multidivaricata TaxID=101098 RepID=UPI00221ED14A|nr:uncharacterized protein BC939DRAFT_219035 [Gamsiella multidivaricata]KAI7831084.1 hypothetical protein BC939DRAFT_219035 [Gamsiella multidivaricata]